jgi:hypothetical protein
MVRYIVCKKTTTIDVATTDLTPTGIQGFAKVTAAPPAPQSPVVVVQLDDPTDKRIKYVPAAVVACFVVIYRAVPSSMEGINEPADRIYIHIILVVVFFFFTPFYQMLIGAPKGTTPLHFYPLSAIAFFGWALGTTIFLKDMRGADNVDDLVPSIILAGTVLIIPAIDGFLTSKDDNKQAQQPSNALVPTGRPDSEWSKGLLLGSVLLLFIVTLILLLLNLILDRQC